MEPSIYSYSLCIALPLMLFFGFYFLLAPTPEKAIFDNYLLSRRIMGLALLLLAGKLFGAFLLRGKVQECPSARHIDESAPPIFCAITY